MTRLTKKQSDSIDALMQSRTVSQAARKAGVSRGTLARWLHDPDFQRELRAARGRAYALTMNRIVHMTRQALDVFADIFAGNTVSKAKFLAACKVLEYAAGVRAEDAQSRMDEIEARLERFEGAVE